MSPAMNVRPAAINACGLYLCQHLLAVPSCNTHYIYIYIQDRWARWGFQDGLDPRASAGRTDCRDPQDQLGR